MLLIRCSAIQIFCYLLRVCIPTLVSLPNYCTKNTCLRQIIFPNQKFLKCDLILFYDRDDPKSYSWHFINSCIWIPIHLCFNDFMRFFSIWIFVQPIDFFIDVNEIRQSTSWRTLNSSYTYFLKNTCNPDQKQI